MATLLASCLAEQMADLTVVQRVERRAEWRVDMMAAKTARMWVAWKAVQSAAKTAEMMVVMKVVPKAHLKAEKAEMMADRKVEATAGLMVRRLADVKAESRDEMKGNCWAGVTAGVTAG